MLNKQRLQLTIILPGLALLMGHFVTSTHSVEHPFHELIPSCQICFALEQSEADPVADSLATTNSVLHANRWLGFTALLLPQAQTTCPIRAPPSLS